MSETTTSSETSDAVSTSSESSDTHNTEEQKSPERLAISDGDQTDYERTPSAPVFGSNSVFMQTHGENFSPGMETPKSRGSFLRCSNWGSTGSPIFGEIQNRSDFLSKTYPLRNPCFATDDDLCVKSPDIGAMEASPPILPSPSTKYYSLNTVEKPQIFSAAFRSISGEEVARLMNSGTLEQFYSRYIIIDCRYPYEYRGGHIRGALNISETRKLDTVFFPDDKEKFDEMSGKIPIFYCEYSQKRGPTAAEYLREIDRVRNAERYPRLDYEEIYVLDRGYKQFFEDGRFSKFCSPFGYVRMFATPFRSTLAKYNSHRTRGNRYQPHTLKDRNKRLQNFLEQAEQSPLQFKRLRQSPGVCAANNAHSDIMETPVRTCINTFNISAYSNKDDSDNEESMNFDVQESPIAFRGRLDFSSPS